MSGVVRRTGAIVAVMLVIAVAGCATVTAAEAPPSASRPAVEDPADPSTWVVDDTRIGPLRIGMTAEEALAAVPDVPFQDREGHEGGLGFEKAREYRVIVEAGDALGIIQVETGATGEVIQLRIATGEATVSTMNGSLRPLPSPQLRFEAYPRTAEGIGIGSTLAEVRAAYPKGEFGEPVFAGAHVFARDGFTPDETAPGVSLSVAEDVPVHGIVVEAADTTSRWEDPEHAWSWRFDETRVGPIRMGEPLEDVLADAETYGWQVAHGADGCVSIVTSPGEGPRPATVSVWPADGDVASIVLGGDDAKIGATSTEVLGYGGVAVGQPSEGLDMWVADKGLAVTMLAPLRAGYEIVSVDVDPASPGALAFQYPAGARAAQPLWSIGVGQPGTRAAACS